MAEAHNVASVPEQACGLAVAHAIHTWGLLSFRRLCLGVAAPAVQGEGDGDA